jgi:hypothetical protein
MNDTNNDTSNDADAKFFIISHTINRFKQRHNIKERFLLIEEEYSILTDFHLSHFSLDVPNMFPLFHF